VSKSEFVAKADAICRASDAKVSALYERLGEPQDDADILTLVHQAADIQVSALNRAREIGEPDSGAASLERLFDDAEAEFTAAKSAASRADVDRMDKNLKEILPRIRAWGFKSCGGQG